MRGEESSGVSVTVTGLPEEGIQVIGPYDAAYEAAFQQVVGEHHDVWELARPWSIFLYNGTKADLYGFGVKSEFKPAGGGKPRIGMTIILNDQPAGPVVPSGRLLYVLLHPYLAVKSPSARPPDEILEVFREPSDRQKSTYGPGESTVWLDYVVFENGDFVGPDKSNSLPTVQARFSTKRRLLSELLRRYEAGERVDAIVDSLESEFLSPHEDESGINPLTDPQRFYGGQAADEFRGLFENRGVAGLLAHAREALAGPEFVVRRK